MRRIVLLFVCFSFTFSARADNVLNKLLTQILAIKAAGPVKVPAGQFIEVAFSPEGGGEALVLKTIGSAKSSLYLAAYSFTSPSVVRALIDAKRRGVKVAVLVDHKSNVQDARNNASKKALNLLVNAGIVTRTIKGYSIHHDKYIVVDELHTETGSFNYTMSAAKFNSENVIVIWNNPQVAKQYLDHWQSRWRQGKDYSSSY